MNRIALLLFAVLACITLSQCKKDNDNPSNNYTNPIKYKKDSIIVSVPTAFTPNGDGRNDMFRVVTTGNGFTAFKLTVYKDNGTTVFESTNVHQGWDGTDGSGHFYTDYHYTVHLRFTIAGNSFDGYSYLYLLAGGSGCVHARSGDVSKYIFEDQIDMATGDSPYVTGESFCP